MKRLALAGLLAALPLIAQNSYVPPAPVGIAGEGKTRILTRPLEFPSEKLPWIRIRSRHFDVISSAGAERTQAIVAELETMAEVLKRASSRFETAPAPTTIFVFSNRADTQAWFDLLLGPGSNRLGGAYVRHPGGGTMIVDAANTRRVTRTAMHELVHDLLRQGDLVPPLWLEEGLAEYFGVARVYRDRVEAGGSIREHSFLLRRAKKLMTLETMFATEAETKRAISGLFYAQSWAAVDWLMQLDSDVFYAFLQDLEQGVPVADALAARYRKTLPDLESAIRRRWALSGTTVRFDSKRMSKEEIMAVELDRPTLLCELGRFLSRVPGAEHEADRHFRAALELNPRHARTLSALGRHEEAVATDPNDPEVLLAYAESLMAHGTGPFAGVFQPGDTDIEGFRKARELAKQAHALVEGTNTAVEGRALGDLGTSYLVEIRLAEGIAYLERAHALVPRRMDFALNLYAMLLSTGNRARADALFASTFAKSRDRQVIFAARNVLLTAEVNRANALSRAGKMDEAAALVRELAAATEDERGRGELERQAKHLEETAAVNRHIRMFNEAVDFVNANKKEEALKLLEEILRQATDALVLADAKQLLNELRK